MSKNLVIVESPAKAKTIEKYLGKDYKVMSSVGHIRKDTKVEPERDFAITYEIDPEKKKLIDELKKAAKAADTVWLATDEDREGEAIAWHLKEVLGLPNDTKRITFHEITENALKEAIKNPRKINMDMVASQQARQSLDMLVGYDLSGVVRRKVPGAKSAGRVQSPALRLVVEKEREIENHEKTSTFKVTGKFAKKSAEFPAVLEKITPDNEKKATELFESLKDATFTVGEIKQTDGKKANPVPLTTAALQIEASAKLGFSARTTMRAAQALYQAGLITYHRTDSLNLSSQAIAAMAAYIKEKFGDKYHQVRHFRTKSAGAQEAHEAIRPTNFSKTTAGQNNFEKKLYHLIWSRTLATQMANAVIKKTTVPIETGKYTFKATGEIVIFDGFLKVYGKSKDTELPALKKGDEVKRIEIVAHETFAKAPSRYTEGSLVKKLEELGIGRPSTYATIMDAIQTRDYVHKGESEGQPRDVVEIKLTGDKITQKSVSEKSGATKGKLLPTPTGELLSDFLTKHFTQAIDYGFTAKVEKDLDKIAEQKLERVKMLKDFYGPFTKLITKAGDVERFNGARELGTDPETGGPIFAKIGKNGGFIQLGLNEKESGKKPRFAPLPKGKTTKTVTLAQALKQLALPALPRSLGQAKDGTEIIAASGPFGPYLKAGKYNIPIKDHDPYTIDLKTALPLYQAKLDSIIADWGDIMIIKGAYGPYIKGPGRRNNVKIPKDQDPTKITEQQAQEMLANKPKTKRRAPRRKSKSKKKA